MTSIGFYPVKGYYYDDLTLFGTVSFRLRLPSLEQLLVAELLRILLTRAGIESNPDMKEFFCCVCAKRLHPNSTSVRCSTCNGWSYLNICSDLKIYREWTSTAVKIASSSRTALPLQSSGQQRTTRSQGAQAGSMTPSLISPSSHQPSSHSNHRARTTRQLLVPHVTSVKCNFCTGGVTFRRVPAYAPRVCAVCSCDVLQESAPQHPTVASPNNTIVRQSTLRVMQLQQPPPTHHSLTPRITTRHLRQTRLLQFASYSTTTDLFDGDIDRRDTKLEC